MESAYIQMELSNKKRMHFQYYVCNVNNTWVLKETIKKKLMVFERKVLRKIFGPTNERDGTWRIKTSDELDELIKNKNVINHIEAQKLSWFGNLQRMSDERMVKKKYISGK